MAKANVELRNGTKVTIEGSPEEVASLLSALSGSRANETVGSKSVRKHRKIRRSATLKAGLTSLLRDVKAEGYFRTSRTLPDVQKALQGRGKICSQPPLSATLLRLVRAGELRRVKENKGWAYVDPDRRNVAHGEDGLPSPRPALPQPESEQEG